MPPLTVSLTGLAVLAAIGSFQLRSVGALRVHVPIERNVDKTKRSAMFFDPAPGGGSMLIDTGNGLGEPMNVRLPFCFSSCLLLSLIASGCRKCADATVSQSS